MSELAQTPSAAALLIDSLHPKQRAILFAAIEHYKQDIEQTYDEQICKKAMHPVLSNRIEEYVRWNVKQCKEIMATLFNECFLEDLDPVKHFSKDLPINISKEIHLAMAR